MPFSLKLSKALYKLIIYISYRIKEDASILCDSEFRA